MSKNINPFENYSGRSKEKKKKTLPFLSEDKNTGGVLGGLGYVGGKLGLGLGGVVEGVTDIVAAGGDLLRGDTEMAEYRFKDNVTGDAARELEEWYNPNKAMSFVGGVSEGVGNSLVFMIPYVGPYVAAAGYLGRGISSAAEQTGKVGWNEIGYGAVSAGAEFVLDKFVGGAGRGAKNIGSAILKKTGTSAVKTAAKATGKSAARSILTESLKGAAGEFAEEAISEAADPYLLKFFNIDENAETSLFNVLYAGAVGAVSGSLMTAGPAAINYNQSVKAGRAVKEAGEVDILLQRAKNAVGGATRAQKRVEGEKIEGKAKYSEDDGVLGRAVSWNKATFGTNRKAKQESKQAKQLRETLEKNIKGYEGLNEKIKNSDAGDAVLGELLGNVYLLENAYRVDLAEELLATATPEQKQAFVEEINAEAVKAGNKKTDYTVADLDNDVDGIRRAYASKATYEMMLEKVYGAENATETATEAQEGAEKATGEQASAEEGKADTGENWVNPGKTDDEVILFDVAHELGMDKIETEMLATTYRKGVAMEPEAFARAFYEGAVYGKYNIDPRHIREDSLLARMNPFDREQALEAGRISALEQAIRRDKAAEKKKAPEREPEKQKKKTYVTLELSEGKRMRDLTETQYVAYKTAEVIGEVLRTDIILHSTLGDSTAGKVNGYFDTTDNTIHIALDAGQDARGTALFALAHEVTHYVYEWSPRKFEALSDFVGERMGADMERLISEKVDLLRKLDDYKGMTVSQLNDAAHEEVIADAMETILSDGTVMEDLATYDESIWQKIKSWIIKAIEAIKKAYAELSPNSQAAKVLKETVDDMSELQRLWAEGVREAGERTRRAGTLTRMNEEKMHVSGKKFSIRTEYAQEIEDWKADGKPAGESFVLGMTGDVLQGLGAIESDIYINGDKIKEIMKDHPEMTLEEIKKIPQIIEDPVLILKSRNVGRDGQMNSRMVIFGAVKAENGQPVMSVLDLHPTENNFTISDMQKVTSAYTKTTSPVQFVKDSFIVYADKKRTASLLRSIGFHMPIELNKSGYIGSISYKGRSVNIFGEKFSDIFVEGKRKYSIQEPTAEAPETEGEKIPDVSEFEDETPLEAAARRMREREAEEKGDAWTLEDEDRRRQAIRDHELLADALMETARSESEYRTVKQYKEKVEVIADAEIRITELRKKTAELNREMDSLREKIKGVEKSKREVWVMTALDEATTQKDAYLKEMDELSEMIRKEEAKLLSLAAAKPLQKAIREANKKADAMARVAEKEKQRAEEDRERSREREAKIRQKAKESADKRVQKEKERMDRLAGESKERGEITIRKRTVMRVLGALETKMYHPTKTNHVPKELHDLAMKTLAAADPGAFSKNRTNIKEMGELAAKIEKLTRKADRTAKEQSTMDGWKARYEELEGETIPLRKQAEAMLTAFIEYNDKAPEDLKLPKGLINIMTNRVAEIEDVPLSQMGLRSLEAVETFVTKLSQQVTSANELFAQKRGEQVSEWGNISSREASESKPLKLLSPTEMERKGTQKLRDYLWKNMKPLTAFEAIGSSKLMELFQAILDGEEVWIKDILEAKEALDKAKKDFGYDKWDHKARRELKTAEGKTVRLTVGELMSLYAYAQREQAKGHLTGRGFKLDPRATEITEKGKLRLERALNQAETYRMTEEDFVKVASMLTEDQKKYAETVQGYLTSLGEKGNEVSQKLYGMDAFTEEHYFPIKVISEVLASQTGKTGDPKIKNRGAFQETTPDAKETILLQDFMEITGGHVNDMATYHAFVLPVEDLTRVLNYKPSNVKIDEEGNWVEDTERKDFRTLKEVITAKYGTQAVSYIEQLLRDLNGGARRDAAATILDKGLTAFKRSATMLSLSTIVQQPTSILRAMAYLDMKHFGGAKIYDYETVKKYAPVASIKEIGGPDTGTGVRTSEYINAKEYDKLSDKFKAAAKPEVYGGDPQARAELFGWLTAKFDEGAWRYLFGACVNEQAEKLGKAKDSEAVLEAAGKRFTEIVRRTQVYDSTLTRSEYMRSKDGLMKMATAFGAEPTTVISMLMDGLIKGQRGDWGFFLKTAAGVAMSVIANSILVSLVYAARDDDEDETYAEKYLQSLVNETIERFNPLEYLPIARDVMSLFKGYEIERSDMALVGNLMEQVEMITNSKRSVPDKVFGVTGAVASFFGLPVTNVYRDVKGIVKTGMSFANAEQQTASGFKHATGDAVRGYFNLFSLFSKIFGAESGNAYELYTAYVNGDTAHYERVKARYDSEEAAELALRGELRDNDKRINQAAWCKHTGDLELYESLVDQIEAEGIFDRNIVIRAINNEVSEIKREIEKDNLVPKDEADPEDDETAVAEGLYTTTDMTLAMERGDAGDMEAIISQMVRDKVDGGKTEKEAKASLRSSSTAYWKKRYIAAWEANNATEMRRIRDALEASGLYGDYNEIIKVVQGWIRNSQ